MARATLRRGDGKPDRFEAENANFHQRLRQAFLAIAAEEPARCAVIDAAAAKETVARDVWGPVRSKAGCSRRRPAASSKMSRPKPAS